MSYPPPIAPPARGLWGWFKARKPITQVLLPLGVALALCCCVPASCSALITPAKDDTALTRTADEAAAAAASARVEAGTQVSPSVSPSASPSPSPTPAPTCHPNYSVCLPIVSDLNCPDIQHKNFKVIGGADPYGLDGNDNDGIACETSTPTTTKAAPPKTSPKPPPPPPPANDCHPNYSVCLPIVGDLDCGEISQKDFRVLGGSDPYRLDADNDGIACES